MREFNQEEIKEMEKIAQNFEAKLKLFTEDVECENPIQVILKGHLYIEHELRELLKNNLENPEVLDCDKLGFSQLVKIVFSLGLLPLELLETAKEINRIRNLCSHDLNFKFGVREYDELEKTFSAGFNEYYQIFSTRLTKPNSELEKLQMALFTMWEQVSTYNLIPDHIKELLV